MTSLINAPAKPFTIKEAAEQLIDRTTLKGRLLIDGLNNKEYSFSDCVASLKRSIVGKYIFEMNSARVTNESEKFLSASKKIHSTTYRCIQALEYEFGDRLVIDNDGIENMLSKLTKDTANSKLASRLNLYKETDDLVKLLAYAKAFIRSDLSKMLNIEINPINLLLMRFNHKSIKEGAVSLMDKYEDDANNSPHNAFFYDVSKSASVYVSYFCDCLKLATGTVLSAGDYLNKTKDISQLNDIRLNQALKLFEEFQNCYPDPHMQRTFIKQGIEDALIKAERLFSQ